MKTVRTEDAVGHILCHDITQIIPGKFKGRKFKKGHVITEEDIPILLSLGKDHLYVWENKEGYLHENDAAKRLYNLAAGKGLVSSEVKEGKINFFAEYDGLLKIDTDLLLRVNSLGEIIISTRHNNTPVKKGQTVAGTRVIPLVIEENKINAAEKIVAEKSIINVLPFKKRKVGVVTTGNEVYYGRIKDAFLPVIKRKVLEYDCEVIGNVYVPDDSLRITEEIQKFIEKGAEIVVCTGGMSVDPDDVTPKGIKNTGADVITYGAPVLPGAMFLLAYKNNIPILGLPACVMYSKTTVFDLILPRVLVGDSVTKEEIAALGHGGLCLECQECKYPDCSFGKGW